MGFFIYIYSNVFGVHQPFVKLLLNVCEYPNLNYNRMLNPSILKVSDRKFQKSPPFLAALTKTPR